MCEQVGPDTKVIKENHRTGRDKETKEAAKQHKKEEGQENHTKINPTTQIQQKITKKTIFFYREWKHIIEDYF